MLAVGCQSEESELVTAIDLDRGIELSRLMVENTRDRYVPVGGHVVELTFQENMLAEIDHFRGCKYFQDVRRFGFLCGCLDGVEMSLLFHEGSAGTTASLWNIVRARQLRI